MADVVDTTARDIERKDKISRCVDFENLMKDNAKAFSTLDPMLNINSSSLGGCCRAMWYRKSGFPDERPDDSSKISEFIFGLGNAVENFVVEILTHFRITAGKPRIRNSELNISGEIDKIIMEAVDGKEVPIVIEVKSAWSKAYAMKVKALENGIMDAGHFAQIQSYFLCNQGNPAGEFPYAYYILLNKNMNAKDKLPPFVVYKVYPDEREFARIRAWIAELQEHLKSGIPPNRPYSRSAWQCSYCGFASICYSGYENEVEDLEDFAGGDCIDETK
jgi:CRISPR/Cas system-associated exonuclease Cas4 (RecB family)